MSLSFEFIHKDNYTETAVLLFHGFTGSPFEMKKYGQFLYKNGVDVYAHCIPGHGDNSQDIFTVTYQDWLTHAYRRFEELHPKYKNIFISGVCLGAVLALAIGIKYSDKVQGIIPLSTTLYLDGWRLPWYKFLIPLGLSTIIRFYYRYPECEPHGIKNLKTRNAVKKLLEIGDVGMNYFPMTGIYELLKLSSYVRKNLRYVTAPTLLIHSMEDDLTSVKSANVTYKEISSLDKKLIILNDSYHMVLYDNEKEFVYNETINFIKLYTSKTVIEEATCI